MTGLQEIHTYMSQRERRKSRDGNLSKCAKRGRRAEGQGSGWAWPRAGAEGQGSAVRHCLEQTLNSPDSLDRAFSDKNSMGPGYPKAPAIGYLKPC